MSELAQLTDRSGNIQPMNKLDLNFGQSENKDVAVYWLYVTVYGGSYNCTGHTWG